MAMRVQPEMTFVQEQILAKVARLVRNNFYNREDFVVEVVIPEDLDLSDGLRPAIVKWIHGAFRDTMNHVAIAESIPDGSTCFGMKLQEVAKDMLVGELKNQNLLGERPDRLR